MNDNERSNLARTIRKYREARKMTMKQLSIRGLVKVESKKDLAKRGIPSPNIADAFIMAFAEFNSFGRFK